MTRFLLIPKEDGLADILAGDGFGMAPATRAGRLQAVVAGRRAQARRESRASSDALRDIGVNVRAVPLEQTPITGVTIFDGTAEDAQKVQEALPDQDVVEDFDIELIAPVDSRPLRNGDAAGDGALTAADLDLWHLEAIGLLRARADRFGVTGAGATVAVMDTGIAEHDELKGKIADNIVFDVANWEANSAAFADTDIITPGHGTHVGGIIAGTQVGVAPGAKLFSYTMLPERVGSLSHFVFAFEHVQTRPDIQIINMSAGKRDSEQPARMRYLARIAQRLDMLFVVAVGNEGPNTSRVPGNYPEVLSVAACNRSGKVWSGGGSGTVMWGNQARVVPDLFAPGVEICSLTPDGGYQFLTGTSMATPVVSGIAALLLEKWPEMTRPELIDEIMQAVDALNLSPPLTGKGSARLPPRLHPGPPAPAGNGMS